MAFQRLGGTGHFGSTAKFIFNKKSITPLITSYHSFLKILFDMKQWHDIQCFACFSPFHICTLFAWLRSYTQERLLPNYCLRCLHISLAIITFILVVCILLYWWLFISSEFVTVLTSYTAGSPWISFQSALTLVSNLASSTSVVSLCTALFLDYL